MRSLAVISLLVLCAFALPGAQIKGEKAPLFEGKAASGKTIKLSKFKGKIVLLDFWASQADFFSKYSPINQHLDFTGIKAT